jgi:lipoate-protein ligase A
MDTPRCRLLPFTTAEGPWQMAADEVLLGAAAAGRAALRFYAWSQPTISLGYFQADAPRRSDPRLVGLPAVRRASGGAALVHDREVTYALALPAGVPWQRHGESWLWRMHGIIAAALATLGVEVRACDPGKERKLGEVLCFLHHTPGDLLIGPAKVAGSAQRKLRGALLQHGGILLAQSPATPALPGITELAGRQLAARDVQAAVIAQFARDTGWPLEPGDWTEDEHQRIAELAAAKYTRSSWNQKR